MSIADRSSCGFCVYWQMTRDREKEGWESEGVCRRHAPVAIPSKDMLGDGTGPDGEVGVLTAWPKTFFDSDWCGELKELDPLGRGEVARKASEAIEAKRSA